MSETGSKDVDAYIAAAPKAAQPKLTQLRKIIRSAAPKAEERISYKMPYYDLNGRLVYFALHAKHVGVYALGQTAELAKGRLARYVSSKGTLQFPLDEPLPEAEITRLIKKRVAENESRAKARPSRTR
ncbi:MAG TPA: DUF1801 domain-containing protein [Candidatus Dormibacteraeota bacterium]|nr:DUF1801 domain-containing protein [Candidatus Dormibacteraeota bacterium]